MIRFVVMLFLVMNANVSFAEEELILTAHNNDGEIYPYILNFENRTPSYLIILFPGGDGNLDPKIIDGKLAYKLKGNFVIKTRNMIVDHDFATVATNSSQSVERIQAIIDDIYSRFPSVKIYLMSTSNGTFDSLFLSAYLSDKIAGVIHTSYLKKISTLDAKLYKNRQLIVHHEKDGCSFTPFVSAEYAHEKYGTDLIVMEGGISVGDPCEPLAHHGYNGIRKETIEAIKNWIKQDQ